MTTKIAERQRIIIADMNGWPFGASKWFWIAAKICQMVGEVDEAQSNQAGSLLITTRSQWRRHVSQTCTDSQSVLHSGVGAHDDRDKPRVPPNLVFSLVLGHLFFSPWHLKKKTKTFVKKWDIPSQLSEETTFLGTWNTGFNLPNELLTQWKRWFFAQRPKQEQVKQYVNTALPKKCARTGLAY